MRRKRFDVIKSLLIPANAVADVGCDHGIIAEYCADSGMFQSVIASDISEKCLNKARERLKNKDCVRFVCADGIDYECDEAVIAGMGGLLICDILENALSLPNTLVLCPHRNADSVRRTLVKLGYGLDADIPVSENGKFYSVIRARLGGGQTDIGELEILFGLHVAEYDETLADWLKKQYNTYSVAPEANADRLKSIRAALRLQGINTFD